MASKRSLRGLLGIGGGNLLATSSLVLISGLVIVGAGVYLLARPLANKYVPGVSGVKVPYIDPALGLPGYSDDY